jgi:hypothetical protein
MPGRKQPERNDSPTWSRAAAGEMRILRVLGTELGTGNAYDLKQDFAEEGSIFKLLVRG